MKREKSAEEKKEIWEEEKKVEERRLKMRNRENAEGK